MSGVWLEMMLVFIWYVKHDRQGSFNAQDRNSNGIAYPYMYYLPWYISSPRGGCRISRAAGLKTRADHWWAYLGCGYCRWCWTPCGLPCFYTLSMYTPRLLQEEYSISIPKSYCWTIQSPSGGCRIFQAGPEYMGGLLIMSEVWLEMMMSLVWFITHTWYGLCTIQDS